MYRLPEAQFRISPNPSFKSPRTHTTDNKAVPQVGTIASMSIQLFMLVCYMLLDLLESGMENSDENLVANQGRDRL